MRIKRQRRERFSFGSAMRSAEAPNKFKPAVYAFGLAVIGEKSVIPAGVKIGKNTAISGITTAEDYPNGILESGESIIKEGDMA